MNQRTPNCIRPPSHSNRLGFPRHHPSLKLTRGRRTKRNRQGPMDQKNWQAFVQKSIRKPYLRLQHPSFLPRALHPQDTPGLLECGVVAPRQQPCPHILQGSCRQPKWDDCDRQVCPRHDFRSSRRRRYAPARKVLKLSKLSRNYSVQQFRRRP